MLEERVAGGELSLRGVNPATLALPEELLVDVDTPDALAELERPGHALVVGGTGMLAPRDPRTGCARARGHLDRAPRRRRSARA